MNHKTKLDYRMFCIRRNFIGVIMTEENFSESAFNNISVSDSTKTVDLSKVSDVIINLLEQELKHF